MFGGVEAGPPALQVSVDDKIENELLTEFVLALREEPDGMVYGPKLVQLLPKD